MRDRITHARVAALAAGVLLTASVPSFAALGGAPMSRANNHVVFVTDVAHVAASAASAAPGAPSTSGTLYTVNVVTLESGTVVREYVDPETGNVFGAVWQGPHVPDLSDVLGASFTRFAGSATHRPESVAMGISHRSLASSDLVVNAGGHPGLFFGKAYLPTKLPAGVSATDIQ